MQARRGHSFIIPSRHTDQYHKIRNASNTFKVHDNISLSCGVGASSRPPHFMCRVDPVPPALDLLAVGSIFT